MLLLLLMMHFTLVDDSNADVVTCGWGHSMRVNGNEIQMAGRPYEFSTLLRLHRLPSFLRIPVIQSTLDQKYSSKTTQ